MPPDALERSGDFYLWQNIQCRITSGHRYAITASEVLHDRKAGTCRMRIDVPDKEARHALRKAGEYGDNLVHSSDYPEAATGDQHLVPEPSVNQRIFYSRIEGYGTSGTKNSRNIRGSDRYRSR